MTPAGRDRADRFRRVLLGSVTALVVARPLVAGEDPGRLHSLDASSGQILNFLWLVIALAGAVWLARAARPFRLGGPAALGLMGLALIVLLSAVTSDGFRHPAWLVACEWAVLPVAFALTRELTPDADSATDSAGGVLSAILATGVSLAAFAVYQALADAARLGPADLPLDATPPGPPADDFAAFWPKMVRFDWVARATLERSDTFAGFLLLLIPAAWACCWRERSKKARLTLAAAIVMLLALVLAGRDYVNGHFPRLLADGWQTAGKMIAGRPLLGVGPGNFDRHAAPLQPASRAETLTDPWGLYPELAATCGLPALLAFLALAGFTLRKIWRTDSPVIVADAPAEQSPRLPRWEFYLGGVAGLLLGLALRIHDLPGGEPSKAILTAGVGAVGRALVWFLAFSLFESARWSQTSRRNALLLGLGLVLLHGLASGALLRPALLQPFWVIAALALGGGTVVFGDESATRAIRWTPIPVLLAAVLAFGLLVAGPAARSARASWQAHMATVHYNEKIYYDAVTAPAKEFGEREARHAKAIEFLDAEILAHLREAARADSGDSARHLELAAWRRVAWRLDPRRKIDESLGSVIEAGRLDPYSAAPPLREFLIRLTFASIHRSMFSNPIPQHQANIKKLRDEQLQKAEELIPHILERDPALEARLRFRLAQAFLETKSDPDSPCDFLKRGNTEAARALTLDESAASARGRLTTEQRTQVRKWLDLPAE